MFYHNVAIFVNVAALHGSIEIQFASILMRDSAINGRDGSCAASDLFRLSFGLNLGLFGLFLVVSF